MFLLPDTLPRCRLKRFSILVILLAACLPAAARGDDAGRQALFQNQLVPLLRTYCYDCHGASGISDGDRHNHDDLPILLAGKAGGRITSGRHIRYKIGTPLCNLYLWMLHQMGAAVDRFGDSDRVLDHLA